MLRKKYRIGIVGFLNVIYKRIDARDNATKEKICCLCGIGEDVCSNIVVAHNSAVGNITYGSICTRINRIVSNYTSKFEYIPWKLS